MRVPAEVIASDSIGSSGEFLDGWEASIGVDDRIERVSAALSRTRGKRWLHPVGEVYEGVLDVPGGARTDAELLDIAAAHETIVRISRAAGTPRPLPDAYGLAFRVLDRHVDLLLTTSIDAPVLHHLPMPAPGGPWAQTYSSLLAYDVGGRTCLLGALPRPRERAFDLAIAPVRGRWGAPLARLRLTRRLPDEAALDLDPWNCGAGITPTGPLQGLRRPAYRGSRRGRKRA